MDEKAFEKWKADIEIWKTNIQQHLATYKIINLAGQNALKGGLLLNGGAAVALLAFIGATIANNSYNKILLLDLTDSMMRFIIGALLFAIAGGVAYLALYADANLINDKKKIAFHSLNIISNILCILGYGLFIWGAVNAYFAFRCSIMSHV